ncbi:hypothetical protein QJS65_10290 [Bacillus altitudinis]|uniref:hypothetical protein n=1 Tax=Bacillus altitudinis TaxID=293387 RepID=UPI0024A9AEA0|nr:hypothetical protein [Bacillus altitudinis]WHF25239.1 hypothetical protein QJS65_10290 [Bacillus altitudinis]
MKKRLRKKLKKIEQDRRYQQFLERINGYRERHRKRVSFLLENGESFTNNIMRIVLEKDMCTEDDLDFESFHFLHGAMHHYASKTNRILESLNENEFGGINRSAYYLINDNYLKVRELQNMGTLAYFESVAEDEKIDPSMTVHFEELVNDLKYLKNDKKIHLW